MCSVYLDIRKAFDSVPHSLLIQKLTNIQVDPYVVQWINCYLAETERSQMVVVGGVSSSTLPVLSGVPQGSVLGPLLFLIYMNDVTETISPESTLSLFADDMAIYRPIRTTHDHSALQRDISAIATWISNNLLSLQPAKCCAMLISRKRSAEQMVPPIYVQGTPLPYVTSVKYLGVLLTTNLSWSEHVSALNAKARKLIGVMFRKFYKDAHPTSLLNLYLANIRPHLEYCSPVWDPYLRKDIDMLEKAQKFGLRVCLKDWSSQYETLLQQSKIQSLSERRTKTNLTYIHKIVHEKIDFPGAPIKERTFQYCSRSNNSRSLIPFNCKSAQFLNSYFPKAVKGWNSLPEDIVTVQSTQTFKRLLSSHIL